MRHAGSRWGFEQYSEQTRPEQPRYVNIGAGSFFHPLWHNLDAPGDFYHSVTKNVDFLHDLSLNQPLPFDTASIDLFYSSHVLEHLEAGWVTHLVQEVARTLRPGGLFRVTVPDAAYLYQAYLAGDRWAFRSPTPWGSNPNSLELVFAEYVATGSSLSATEIRHLADTLSMPAFLDALCATAKPLPESHRNWFDAEKLIGILSEAGLQASESKYLQSRDSRLRDPRLFDSTCPELSVYVEAVKPA